MWEICRERQISQKPTFDQLPIADLRLIGATHMLEQRLDEKDGRADAYKGRQIAKLLACAHGHD
jgi:hypothetical protein